MSEILKFDNGWAHLFDDGRFKWEAQRTGYANPFRACVHELETEAIICQMKYEDQIKKMIEEEGE